MKKVLSVIIAAALLASMSAFAMTSASAKTIWALPLDVSDANWHAETGTNNPDKTKYNWSAPLAEVSDTIIGTSTADGLEMKFPVGGDICTFPNARYENAGGLVQVSEDDYINIKASCGEKDQQSVRWSITLQFSTNKIPLVPAIEDKGYKTINDEGKQLLGGDIEVSLKISDIAKEWFAATPADGNYDKIWGSNGNKYLTNLVFYIFSNERNAEIPLVIKSITIGDEGDFGAPSDGAAAGNNAGTAGNKDSKPAANNNKGGSTASKKPSVGTGESVLPIVGIAALALVATSAVAVSRKRK